MTARQAGFGSFEVSHVPELWPPLVVKQADPRILISDLMMGYIRRGSLFGWEADGDLLRFYAANGTWLYRIGEYLEDRKAWIAEWPD